MMVLYNVTITLERDVADAWLQYMKETHLPDVMGTGMFLSYRLCRLLGHDTPEDVTYTVQYLCSDMQRYEQYRDEFAPALQADLLEKFRDKFVAFRSLMEVVVNG